MQAAENHEVNLLGIDSPTQLQPSEGNMIPDFLKETASPDPSDGSPLMPPNSLRTSFGQVPGPIFTIEKELDITAEDFHKKKRHVLVMTAAGKPVYSRYGDEAELSPEFATLNVVVNKLAAIRCDGKESKVRMITTDVNKTLVKYRDALIFVVISKVMQDSEAVLEAVIDSVAAQVINPDFR